MQLSSADATMFQKKLTLFFGHKNLKKRLQKLLIISPFFFSILLTHTPIPSGSNSPEMCNLKLKISPPTTPHFSVWKPTAGQRLIYGFESQIQRTQQVREQVLVDEISSLCIVCQVVDLFKTCPRKSHAVKIKVD